MCRSWLYSRGMGLFGHVLCRWGSQVFTHRLSCFSYGRNQEPRKISLGPELCYLEGGVMWVKVNCFSHCPNASNLSLFLLPYYAGHLHWTPGLMQRLSCVWLIMWDSVLYGLLDPGCKGKWLVHRLLQGSQLGPRYVCLLPDTWVYGALLSPLACGTGFCNPTKAPLSMDGCQIVIKRGIWWEMSC